MLFHDRLKMAIRRARRDCGHMALLYLDLNEFKIINDTLGHDAGDEVLCEVARRLVEYTRESDTVARLGGDEFSIVLSDISSQDSVDQETSSLQHSRISHYLIVISRVMYSPWISRIQSRLASVTTRSCRDTSTFQNV